MNENEKTGEIKPGKESMNTFLDLYKEKPQSDEEPKKGAGRYIALVVLFVFLAYMIITSIIWPHA